MKSIITFVNNITKVYRFSAADVIQNRGVDTQYVIARRRLVLDHEKQNEQMYKARVAQMDKWQAQKFRMTMDWLDGKSKFASTEQLARQLERIDQAKLSYQSQSR